MQKTTKKLFRLTHRESGGEKKKTFGYGTKMETDDKITFLGRMTIEDPKDIKIR